jgi:hypothetical protein
MRKSDEYGGNVTPLLLNRPMMKDYIANEVLSHWENLRDGRLVPKRSDIDPRALRNALNYTFILEADAPNNIRFRLAGSKLCDCMGMEMRGMPVYSMIDPAARNAFNNAIQTCMARPQILSLRMHPIASMVLLPMADEYNNINRVLGCVTVDPNHPDFPKRFSVLSMTKTRIIAAKSVLAQPMSELAENQQVYEIKKKRATSRKPPFLRIVK